MEKLLTLLGCFLHVSSDGTFKYFNPHFAKALATLCAIEWLISSVLHVSSPAYMLGRVNWQKKILRLLYRFPLLISFSGATRLWGNLLHKILHRKVKWNPPCTFFSPKLREWNVFKFRKVERHDLDASNVVNCSMNNQFTMQWLNEKSIYDAMNGSIKKSMNDQ